ERELVGNAGGERRLRSADGKRQRVLLGPDRKCGNVRRIERQRCRDSLCTAVAARGVELGARRVLAQPAQQRMLTSAIADDEDLHVAEIPGDSDRRLEGRNQRTPSANRSSGWWTGPAFHAENGGGTSEPAYRAIGAHAGPPTDSSSPYPPSMRRREPLDLSTRSGPATRTSR